MQDLSCREIIGYSVGANKTAQLVHRAFASLKVNLQDIGIFHTDRGLEFTNNTIDELLTTFDIKRSLSRPGTPYDNAVAESTFKIIKTEFVGKHKFKTIQELETNLFDYINWFNNKRIHRTLGMISPVDFKSEYSI